MAGVIDAVSYDPRGLPSVIKFHNGVTTAYAYTPGPGRISKQKTVAPDGAVLEDIAYVYDKMDLMLSSNDAAPGGLGAAAVSIRSALSIDDDGEYGGRQSCAAPLRLRG